MTDDPILSDLIRLAAAGEDEAARELVTKYEPELRRFVRYRLMNPELRRLLDSLDVTQSVFARFFAALQSGKLDVASAPQLVRLLRTMATNRLRDHVRRGAAAKRVAPLTAASRRQPEETIATPATEPDAAVEANELVELLRTRFSDEERVLLDLRLQGEGWKDLAESLGGTPDALRKRFTRAVDRVAQELNLAIQ